MVNVRRRRREGGLSVERARHRTSAFVYGNITVLGALVAVYPDAVERGSAALAVAATALATLIAHVTADLVSVRIRPEHVAPKAREELLEELRDALPIASSGSLPVLLLLLGAAGWLAASTALTTAVAVAVGRLALIGVVTERLSGRKASFAAFWGGIGLAATGAAVAVAKATLTH